MTRAMNAFLMLFGAAVISVSLFVPDRAIGEGCTKIELFGNTSIESREIFTALSFVSDQGCVLPFEQSKLKSECEFLQSRFPQIRKIHCGSIVLGNLRTIEVSMLEYAEFEYLKETVSRYRADKPERIELNDSLSPLYVQHRELWFDAVRARKELGEHVQDNVLRYTLPELDELADTLRQQVTLERDVLERVVQQSSLTNHRIAATWLLPWSQPTAETINNTMLAILDESQLVRNNYGRFLHFFVEYIDDSSTLDEVATLAFIQLKMPAHSDRNKAVHILRQLASLDHLNCTEFASRSRREELDQIANRSALPNVGGVAREILERLEVRCGKQTILLQETPSYQEEP